ncbi:MAG: AAA family ATPase [Selenomonadaceae bacterium]|nr:AAA family ATPase [Selenomonadaceae bacterium]
MIDQASRLRNLIEGKTGNGESLQIIAVTSGKGGVGKTSLALNLSIGLQKAGQRVLLIDADIGMANINLLMGRVTNRSLIELLNYKTRIEDVIEESDFGLKYISGISSIRKMLDASQEDLHAMQRKIIDAAKIVDTIVIDTGAGLNRFVLEFILFAREILLVTTSDPAALADAYAIVKACSEYKANCRIKLIVNRVRSKNEWKDTAERLNQTTQNFLDIYVEPLGYVYEDRAVSEAIIRQEPFLIRSPDSAASRCVKALVHCIVTGARMPSVAKGWKNVLKGIFG